MCMQRPWRNLIVPVQRGVNLGWGRAGGRKKGEKESMYKINKKCRSPQYLWNAGRSGSGGAGVRVHVGTDEGG